MGQYGASVRQQLFAEAAHAPVDFLVLLLYAPGLSQQSCRHFRRVAFVFSLLQHAPHRPLEVDRGGACGRDFGSRFVEASQELRPVCCFDLPCS